ncbi:AraC-like DNA-binding protein [Hydrogenispora ethanolica]|jgi:AraC-like DNA-binding protein|uniref:AraC-like DNA-binding protein n=1 Tax=Hydrogenispora ethanolica TaxID=1082276 RepID=A0A4R1RRA9_HYDET|nr:AraC family transcriptional regulator [Hydrogenispora ethanolica]TCL68560.1 AraC-like DNA-binding protein [Hydrogenispora ethanolica]
MLLERYYQDRESFISYSHKKDRYPETFDFHLHNFFEIYFFISGDVRYFIEKQIYQLKPGDLLLINNHEIHRPTFVTPAVYERITVHFSPELLGLFSGPGFDMLQCFTDRPKGEGNKLNLGPEQILTARRLFAQIEEVCDRAGDGAALLRLTYLIELLVYIEQLFLDIRPVAERFDPPEQLMPVLDYIEANLEEDLSLEALERRLYVNRFHLSRLFKQYAGSTLHEYIIYKRIARAKKLLAEGHNVTEACQMSGFRDYSNFIRMFKKTTGIAPGQYKKRV